jgi:hypothetical protein
MNQPLGDILEKLSDILHWLGKYQESNAVAMTTRLVRTIGATTLGEYEAWINQQPHHIPVDRT